MSRAKYESAPKKKEPSQRNDSSFNLFVFEDIFL